MEYTLGFDNAVSNGYATIRVDSDNDVKESDEDNNKLRFRVTN
jgi:subtilase family serine protease